MNKNNGFTLIELMIAIAVAGILLAVALPSFTGLIERKRIGAVAEVVVSQLQYARSEAIKSSRDITVEFLADGSTTWSMGMTDAANCDPSAADSCTIDIDHNLDTDNNIIVRTVSTDFQKVSMALPAFLGTGSPPRTIFDYKRGTATNGTVNISSDNYALSIVLSRMGRSKICVPDGSEAISGYSGC